MRSDWELRLGLLSVIMHSVMPQSTGEGEEEEEQRALKSERRGGSYSRLTVLA